MDKDTMENVKVGTMLVIVAILKDIAVQATTGKLRTVKKGPFFPHFARVDTPEGPVVRFHISSALPVYITAENYEPSFDAALMILEREVPNLSFDKLSLWFTYKL